MTNSPAAVPGNIPALVTLLERQRTLYHQLRTLSDQQGPLAAEALAEPLLSLLAQRQKVIDGVTVVNAQLDPYRQRWSELWAELADGDREHIGELVKEIQELLASIIKQDDRDRGALQAAKVRMGSELQNMARQGQAINAYRAAPSAPAAIAAGDNRFMNQKG